MSRLELPASRSGRYNGAAKAYVIRHRSCVQARDGQTVPSRWWLGVEKWQTSSDGGSRSKRCPLCVRACQRVCVERSLNVSRANAHTSLNLSKSSQKSTTGRSTFGMFVRV
jgi:hypothetical protein